MTKTERFPRIHRAQKKLSAIGAWENSKKAAIEAELRQIEVINFPPMLSLLRVQFPRLKNPYFCPVFWDSRGENIVQKQNTNIIMMIRRRNLSFFTSALCAGEAREAEGRIYRENEKQDCCPSQIS